MSAVIGIGFEISPKEYIETGKKLGLSTLDHFRDNLVEKLKEKFSVDTLYIFYSKNSNLAVFERILSVAQPFSIIHYIDNIWSEGFSNIRDFFESKAEIGLCVIVTDESP